MPRLRFEEAVAQLSSSPQGYCPEAYMLVNSALSWTLTDLGVASDEEKHLTGAELCQGFRRYVLNEFGPISPTILDSWGLHSTRDIGEIVFQLINIGYFRKSPEDKVEDFQAVFDFKTAFVSPFEPKIPVPFP